jgi:hypothetical protein
MGPGEGNVQVLRVAGAGEVNIPGLVIYCVLWLMLNESDALPNAHRPVNPTCLPHRSRQHTSSEETHLANHSATVESAIVSSTPFLHTKKTG